MDFFDILLAKKLEGDRDPTIEGLSVTENGIYTEEGKAYNPVIVEVPEPTLITKSITANGTYSASDDNADGYSQVTVNVEGFKKKSISNTPTDIASFDDGTANPMPSLEISIEPVQSGSGDPSPSNVRPISGWGGANVTRCRVNVWDEEWEVGTIDIRNGSNVPANDRIRSKNFIPCAPNIAYFYVVSVGNMTICFYDKDENYLSYYNFSTEHNFITPDGCYKMKFFTGGAYGTTYNHDISINYPSTDTSYHVYNGSTLSIPFHNSEDNPITVYGGTLNVTSGELTVTMASVDLGTRSYTRSVYGSNTVFYCYIGNCADIPSSQVADALCSCYAITSNDMIYSGIDKRIAITKTSSDPYATVRIANSDYTDVTAFTQSLSNQKLVYPLTTPQTYQLTPTQVSTLLGQNNIFADCGQILDGEYFVTL